MLPHQVETYHRTVPAGHWRVSPSDTISGSTYVYWRVSCESRATGVGPLLTPTISLGGDESDGLGANPASAKLITLAAGEFGHTATAGSEYFLSAVIGNYRPLTDM
jgi:hypothetical protein